MLNSIRLSLSLSLCISRLTTRLPIDGARGASALYPEARIFQYSLNEF